MANEDEGQRRKGRVEANEAEELTCAWRGRVGGAETASRASDVRRVSPRSETVSLRMAYALTSETSHAGHADDPQALSRPPLPQIIYVCRTRDACPVSPMLPT